MLAKQLSRHEIDEYCFGEPSTPIPGLNAVYASTLTPTTIVSWQQPPSGDFVDPGTSVSLHADTAESAHGHAAAPHSPAPPPPPPPPPSSEDVAEAQLGLSVTGTTFGDVDHNDAAYQAFSELARHIDERAITFLATQLTITGSRPELEAISEAFGRLGIQPNLKDL